MDFEPGVVNVLIGANGSGKSNLLEAIGVLSAAANGRVDDEALLRRGVRPGVPALYKSAFKGSPSPRQISFTASSDKAEYKATLSNSSDDPQPVWHYEAEKLSNKNEDEPIVNRSEENRDKYNPQAGLAALKSAEITVDNPAFKLITALQEFAIFNPDTPTLRGARPDIHRRIPVGLSGGWLVNGVRMTLRPGESLDKLGLDQGEKKFLEKIRMEIPSLIDWAEGFNIAFSDIPLLSSVGTTPFTILFKDKYISDEIGGISGFDASEGALYVLFHAVLAANQLSPTICAVDNADHGLNPRLARELFRHISDWYLSSPAPRQIFLTTHNPTALDGLPLEDPRVRLFTVDRTAAGRTTIKRVELTEKQLELSKKNDWPLSRLWVMGHLGGVPNV